TAAWSCSRGTSPAGGGRAASPPSRARRISPDRRTGCVGPRSVPARTLELVVLVGEEHVEAGQRAVAAADVRLQPDLRVVREIGGVDLLLQGPQPVAHHHDLVEEAV